MDQLSAEERKQAEKVIFEKAVKKWERHVIFRIVSNTSFGKSRTTNINTEIYEFIHGSPYKYSGPDDDLLKNPFYTHKEYVWAVTGSYPESLDRIKTYVINLHQTQKNTVLEEVLKVCNVDEPRLSDLIHSVEKFKIRDLQHFIDKTMEFVNTLLEKEIQIIKSSMEYHYIMRLSNNVPDALHDCLVFNKTHASERRSWITQNCIFTAHEE